MAAALSVKDEGAQRGQAIDRQTDSRKKSTSCYGDNLYPSRNWTLNWLFGLENERGDMIYLHIFFFNSLQLFIIFS